MTSSGNPTVNSVVVGTFNGLAISVDASTISVQIFGN